MFNCLVSIEITSGSDVLLTTCTHAHNADALITWRNISHCDFEVLLHGFNDNEIIIVYGDFNGHVGDGYERWHDEEGYDMRNEEGTMLPNMTKLRICCSKHVLQEEGWTTYHIQQERLCDWNRLRAHATQGASTPKWCRRTVLRHKIISLPWTSAFNIGT